MGVRASVHNAFLGYGVFPFLPLSLAKKITRVCLAECSGRSGPCRYRCRDSDVISIAVAMI